MPDRFEPSDWERLLPRIREGKCTPFLGAGACDGSLPLAKDIAQEWAQEYVYPLAADRDDLARVAQFLAVTRDPMFPKEQLLRRFQREDCRSPDFSEPDEPHAVLADLPLPVYLTTNYDGFMVEALRSRHKDPQREYCRWNSFVRQEPSVFEREEPFEPTVANPVVYHLHGHDGVQESLVLTEDDYIDFLVNVWRSQAAVLPGTARGVLPNRIWRALAGTSLLFIGYRLSDWTFRVLFRGIVGAMERTIGRGSVAVQLRRENADEERYLDRYYNRLEVKVYWGTAREFAAELSNRWRTFNESES